MAVVRTPNLDFTVGVRPQAIPVNPSLTRPEGPMVIQVSAVTMSKAINAITWPSGGGGGGSGTSSYPVCG